MRLLLALALLPALALGDGGIAADDFPACIAELRQLALSEGIPGEVVDAALRDARPREEVVRKDANQAEFVEDFGGYLAKRVNDRRIERGREMLATHRDLLWGIYKQYGVPPQVLVAFWGMETHYGTFTGRHPVLPSLATLSCHPRRSEFFRGQLIAALRIVAAGEVTPDIQGSWAGAMGHTQFIPTTYRDYAVDGDGDGRRDLIDSVPDALASAANYLKSIGWRGDQRWGREVKLPAGFPWELASPEVEKPLAQWRALGVTDLFGHPLPEAEIEASLLLPAGHRGPAFLVYPNFRVIMEWNRSTHYALAVGHLADRLVGRAPLTGDPAPERRLTRDEVREIQRRLHAQGFDGGTDDGIIGTRTREAARAYQKRHALPADGHPDAGLLEHLRANGAG